MQHLLYKCLKPVEHTSLNVRKPESRVEGTVCSEPMSDLKQLQIANVKLL